MTEKTKEELEKLVEVLMYALVEIKDSAAPHGYIWNVAKTALEELHDE